MATLVRGMHVLSRWQWSPKLLKTPFTLDIAMEYSGWTSMTSCGGSSRALSVSTTEDSVAVH